MMRAKKAMPPITAPTTRPIEGDPALLLSSREAPDVLVSVGNEVAVPSKDPVGNGN
jgi:hypothetical protein